MKGLRFPFIIIGKKMNTTYKKGEYIYVKIHIYIYIYQIVNVQNIVNTYILNS